MALLIGVLLAVRLGVSVWSTAGIRWDFANYHRTGQRVIGGDVVDLYRLPQSRMDRFHTLIGEGARVSTAARNSSDDPQVPSGRMGFIGFPSSAYAFAPLGWLEPRGALLLFKLECAVFFAVGLTLFYPSFRTAASSLGAATLSTYLLICLLYSPFWFVFSTGGQATALNFVLLVLFWRAFVAGRHHMAAPWLALGILVKPFFALTLPMLAIGREWRLLLRVGVWLLAGISASILLLGWPLHIEWLAVLRDASGGLAEPWWNNTAVFGLVYTVWTFHTSGGLEPAGEVQGATAAAIGITKVIIAAVFGWLSWTAAASASSGTARRERLAVLAVAFALCFSSIVWPHYLAFLFLPLMILLFRNAEGHRSMAIVLWLILVSTLAVESRFAQRFVLSLFDQASYGQAVLAGAFGACTMLLTLGLFAWLPWSGLPAFTRRSVH